MTIEEIRAKLEAGVENSTVAMEGDGCNCSTLVVSPIFEGMSLLARQKIVLAAVRSDIDSGELHALSIKARTPAEANAPIQNENKTKKRKSKFNN